MYKKLVLIVLAFFALSHMLHAESSYVTDRILLGVHQQASEASPIIESIPSGTLVTIIQRQDKFSKIRLASGAEGWVLTSFLKKDKPASAELDEAYASLKKEQESNKRLSEELTKKEREIQVRRDELSNAKTTIKDLRKALKDAGNPPPQAATEEADNSADEAKIKSLEEKIARLEKEKTELADQSGDQAVIELEKLQNENKEFQVRIEAALANLKGETVPTAAELAAIRPSFPVWYWLLLIAMLVIGVVGGIFWVDYQHRRKHGGFRL
jgi:SH3 domain protein